MNDLDRQLYVGTILKTIRKNKGITLSDLSKKCNLSIQYISDIENGNKSSKSETLDMIFRSMNILFNFDVEVEKQVTHLFNRMVHAHICLNIKERTELIEKLTSHPDWEFSYAYPIIQLAKYMATIINFRDYTYDYQNNLCEQMFYIFSNSQKSFYLLLKGIYLYVDLKHYKKAKEELFRSISYSPDGIIAGFTYNQLGILERYDCNYYLAMIYQNKAKEILLKNNCFIRNLSVEISIGILLGEQKYYKEMKEQFLRTYESACILNDKETQLNALYNIAFFAMYCKEYEDAIDYANKLIKMNCYLKDCYYILAWVYVEKDDRINAGKYYRSLEKANKHDDYIIDCYEKCLKARINNKDKTYYKTLVDLYKKLNKKGYSFDKIMVLEYIIEYCDHHELFEEGYGYQKELLKILQKNH